MQPHSPTLASRASQATSQSSRSQKGSASFVEEPESLKGRLLGVVKTIRESYLSLGEIVDIIACTRAYKALGYSKLKDFLDAECDVVTGPSAQVARKIHQFLADDAREVLRDRPDDYAKLAEACRKVSGEKLKVLAAKMAHKKTDDTDGFSLADCDLEELVGNLENLPTKKFKAELAEPRKIEKKAKPETTSLSVLSKDSDFEAPAEQVHEVKVVKKTFTLRKDAMRIVDSALQKALAGLPFSNQNPEEALLEICRAYETSRAGAQSQSGELATDEDFGEANI